jgi:hypothetical protein
MGDVVPFRRKADTERQRPDRKPVNTSRAPLLETIRRVEVVTSVAKLLSVRSRENPRVRFGIKAEPAHADPDDRFYSVVAYVDDGDAMPMTRAMPADRLDDLAEVVRAGVSRWMQAFERRMAMRLVEGSVEMVGIENSISGNEN